MALEPYQRRIGVPNAPGPSNSVDTRVVDIGGNIARLGDTVRGAFEDQVKQAAIDSGSKLAGETQLERDGNGNLVIPKAESGGLYARAAFDQVIAKRYVNTVQMAYQLDLENDLADRREGRAPYDPIDFQQAQVARLEGVMAGIDPSMRGEVGELLTREMLQRVNQFTEEVGRRRQAGNLAGINDQIRLKLGRISKAAELGLSGDDVIALQQSVEQDLGTLHQWGMTAPSEITAAMVDLNWQVGDFTQFVDASRQLVGLAPVIGTLSEEQLQSLETVVRNPYGAEGDATGLNVGGLVEGSGSATYRMPVEGATPGSKFGAARDGGTRSHKGVDLPAPAGTAVKSALPVGGVAQVTWSAKGGNIVAIKHDNGAVTRYMHLGKVDVKNGQRVDANTVLGGVGRTGNATGNTLHLEIMPDGKTAVDPLSVIGTATETGEVEAAQAVAGEITAEVVRGWPAEVRTQALALITDRRGVLREARQAAEQRARDEARAAQDAAQHAELVESIQAMQDNGIAGHYSTKQVKALTDSFEAMVDWKAMTTPQMQAQVGAFVAQNRMVPKPLLSWFENAVRSPNWPSALALYDRVKLTTMQDGANVGDLMVGELDPDTRSLFEFARSLSDTGKSVEEIHIAVDAARAGRGFTPRTAPAAYDEQTKKGQYNVDRNKALRDVYGVSDTRALPPEFVEMIDASFAANLNIYASQPRKALEEAIKQQQQMMVSSAIFTGGIGPRSLRRAYDPTQIQTALVQAKNPDGSYMLPRLKGLRLGESIKLTPLEGSVTRIGRYQVTVMNPGTNTVHTSFQLDLGRELNGWARRQAKRPTPATKPMSVEEANRKRNRMATFSEFMM